MIAFPPAKVNIGLYILRKRADGYHDLSTCFYPIPWYDILEILPSKVLKFESSGISVPGDAKDNLCLKAYHLLRLDFDLPPVQIYLHKMLPMGAGLGGGSSDGAWTLRLLNTLFSLQLSQEKLISYASMLGSDCAFFVHDGPMMGSSRGEVLTSLKLDLKGKFLVVVKPDMHVSTAEAFSGVVPVDPKYDLKNTLETNPVRKWTSLVSNDFEVSVFKKHPGIQTIKEKLYTFGAVYGSMSGSGSAVFGIFDTPVDLRSEFPGMIYWSGKL
jgi:4-diphosphocytidyl-2-C-methyl-D-erythritol kinase